ncbi:hypothetical protein JW756_02955 [Candidatus Woesearchaeota archaeon]|nr:hypothetical protein [Candidatus Woesearchaeota archaeon]
MAINPVQNNNRNNILTAEGSVKEVNKIDTIVINGVSIKDTNIDLKKEHSLGTVYKSPQTLSKPLAAA